jgi:A/G-specific adenine glycosylase
MTKSVRAHHLKFGTSLEIGGSLVGHWSFSKATFRRRLLGWFDRNRRDLPWRHNRDPYRIWVSEVMLQQTTVAAVIPYFERFLRAFPTLAGLAAANEQEVLRLWAGLGYYRRARNLHRAAKILHEEHGGSLPDDAEVWSSLPGVGRYILGAVLSQAFDRRLPIVEANSQRVLCRLFGQDGDTSREPVKSWLWRTAGDLVPRRRAGDFNQALMELGAMVCTPESPRCGECPVARGCSAHIDGRQHEIPRRVERKAPIDVQTVAVAIHKRGRVLLAQRGDDSSRWAGMWEFPHTDRRRGETVDAAAGRLLESIGIRADVERELLTVKHGVTHHRITLTALEATWRSGEFRSSAYAQVKWVRPTELADYPAGSAQRKLFDAVATPRRNLF